MNYIFISYLDRSGSTYLCELLSHYKDVFVFPEAEVLLNFFLPHAKNPLLKEKHETRFRKICLSDPKLKYWQLGENQIRQAKQAKTGAEAFYTLLLAYKNMHYPETNTLVFKESNIQNYMAKLTAPTDKKVFFLSLIRDPRAIYHSQKNTLDPYHGRQMSKSPYKTAYLWKDFVIKSLFLAEKKEHFVIVFYEELVKSTFDYLEYSLAHILSGKPKNSKGEFHQRIPGPQKNIHPHITLPPQTENIFKWKKYLLKKEISIIDTIVFELLQKTPYELQEKKIYSIHNIKGIQKLLTFYYKLC